MQAIAHRYHAKLSKWRNISLHTETKFAQLINDAYAHLKRELPEVTLVHLAIAPANAQYVEHSPNITKNIDAFNAILEQKADHFIPFPALEQNIFLADAHHLNRKGHTLVTSLISGTLNHYVA